MLKVQGVSIQTYPINFQFAHKIGVPLYEILCEKRGLFGGWLFFALPFRNNPKHKEFSIVFKPTFEDPDLEVGCSINHLAEHVRTISSQFST